MWKVNSRSCGGNVNNNAAILRAIKSVCALIPTLFLACACKTTTSEDLSSHWDRVVETVIVTLRGDVNNPGLQHIRQSFTPEAIREAGGGWHVQSLGGFSPSTFTLTRHSGGMKFTWKIRLSDMRMKKWREFRFQEGDEIFVHTRIL
jgi:hypothetical protein